MRTLQILTDGKLLPWKLPSSINLGGFFMPQLLKSASILKENALEEIS